MLHTVKELNKETLDHCMDASRPVILYGSGLYGIRIKKLLDAEGVSPVAFCDANPGKCGKTFKGIPVLSVSEAASRYGDEGLFVIAIASFNQKPTADVVSEVVVPLEKAGCVHICYATDIYQQFGRLDCIARGACVNGEVITVDGVLLPNFFLDADPAIQSSFGQAVSEMLYSPDPEDEAAYYDAPYDLGGSRGLASGDVVLDCGANLGTFSNYAAAKGCVVHAFEPSPATAERMRKSAALYPGKIFVHQLALSDYCGEARFFTSDVSVIADRIVHGDAQDGGRVVSVPVMTLDDFVKERGISGVGFIKSDIEGEERNMVKGSKHVLRDHAPRLSLSSYHIPDDPEVLESIVREYNPRYTVRNVKNKLYGWVE